MRIALVIGVSEYQRLPSLAACSRDAEAIEAVLNETRQFEHRLYLSGCLLAQETKAKILEFLASFRGQHINQALFYFSGHGTLQDGSLLYLLSDFDEVRPRQTSIENEEVDSWLRDLAPEVAVKVTDCCNSGMSYVKDVATIESAVARSKGQFSACYFLAASHADEVTYTGDRYSDFTEHILRGLAQRDLGTIRYKDLIDIVLDSYKDNSAQRPYVVQQGSMRDIFFEQTEETRSLVGRLVGPEEAPQLNPISEELPIKKLLVELIEADARGMITNEAASSCLVALRRSMENVQLDEDLKDIYDISVDFLDAWDADILDEEAIGKWIKRYGEDLFAVPEEEEVKSRVPSHLLDPISASANPWGKVESKIEITGFAITAKMDYDFIRLRLESRYPNVDKYESGFLLLWSKREVVLFRYVALLRVVSWSEHRLPDRRSWKILRFSSSELGEMERTILAFFRAMEKSAKDNLLRRFQAARNPSL